MGIRTANDPITVGERAFMIASDLKAIEEGDLPVRIRNLGGRSEEDGK